MARNKLTDLRDHLFAQLERLGDEDMDDEKIKEEAKRAQAVASVATVIVNSAKLEMQYYKTMGISKATTDFIEPKQISGNA